MPNFVINKNAQENGDHEVHNTTPGCRYMPRPENQIDLGSHPTCHEAVAAAKKDGPILELTAVTIAAILVILVEKRGGRRVAH